MKAKRENGLKQEFIFVEREQETILINRINKYLGNHEKNKVLQTICGLPGVGKSFLVRHVCQTVRENATYDAAFIAYADVSDCVDEIAVYYKLVRELKAYLDKNSIQDKTQEKAIRQFIIAYEWIYGINVQYKDEKREEILSIKQIADTISTKIKEKANVLVNLEDDDILDFVYEIISTIAYAIPYARVIEALARIIFHKEEERQIKHKLQELVSVLASRNAREDLLRKLLIKGIKGEKNLLKPIIILDNFQLNINNDLGRDQTWLSQPGKLMDLLDVMWIIVSRKSVIHQFEHMFLADSIFHEIELQGFTDKEARAYFENNCNRIEDENEGKLYDAVIDKMMEVCKVHEHYADGREQNQEEYTYLPYLLRLVVLHYRALEYDPSCTITPDSFVEIKNGNKEEFFGYYFYKDLNDLMINAFQILSCIPTWDSFWTSVVREKFDNHLLNARYLLFNTAPMEELGDDKFKLHEAIKDSLYNSSRNYIKQDVLKYLFDLFNKVYGSEEAKLHKEIWYQTEHLQTFIELVYAYIEESDIRSIDLISKTMNRIYNDNKDRGTVSESFIRLYSQYIDKVRKEKHIPFIRKRLVLG